MRLNCVLMCLACVGLAAGCGKKESSAAESSSQETPAGSATETKVIAQWHFLGATDIARNTNASKLKEIGALPVTEELKTEVLRKLAKVPREMFHQRIVSGASDFAPLIEPLLDDLLRSESFFQMRGASNEAVEAVLAVRLDDARAQVWKANLGTVLSSWTGIKTGEIETQGFKGWELQKHHAPNFTRFIRAGNWIVLGCGQDKLPLQEEILARIKRENRPVAPTTDYWLNAWADWPQLPSGILLSNTSNLSRVQLTLFGTNQNLRTKIVLETQSELSLKLDAWQIPTNLIHQSFISFAAVRGIGDWLGRQEFIQPFKWEPMPNQFYIWALPGTPFQTFAAAPVAGPTNVLKELEPKIASVANTNLQKNSAGSIQWEANQIVWIGLPFIVPSLQPVHDRSGEFIFAGMFPNIPRLTPLAVELIPQLQQTNLVYCDFEITPERLAEWQNLSQLFLLISKYKQLEPQSPGSKWLYAVGPKLGNTGTEIVQTGPREFTFVRKSSVGFTGIELVSLANWLQATNFPWGGFELQPRPKPRPPRPNP